MAFKTDDLVKIKYTTLSGVIVKGAAVGDDSLIQYRVQYDDNDGVPQERFFYEAELELA